MVSKLLKILLIILVTLIGILIVARVLGPQIDNNRMSAGVDTIPIYPGGKIINKEVIPDDHWTQPGTARVTYTLPGSTSFNDLRGFYVKNGFSDEMYADSGSTQFANYMQDSIGSFRLSTNGSFGKGGKWIEVSCEADYFDKRNIPFKGKPDACHQFVNSNIEVKLEYY